MKKKKKPKSLRAIRMQLNRMERYRNGAWATEMDRYIAYGAMQALGWIFDGENYAQPSHCCYLQVGKKKWHP
jgi:hypothetical protein